MVGCALCVPKEAKIKEEGPLAAGATAFPLRALRLDLRSEYKESVRCCSLACKFLPHLMHRPTLKFYGFAALLTDCKISGRRLVSQSHYVWKLIGSEAKLALAIFPGPLSNEWTTPASAESFCARSIKASTLSAIAL
jgi:hypothetical protein